MLWKKQKDIPVAVAVATGVVMSVGGFSFMSSIRLLPFKPVLFTLLVLRRSFNCTVCKNIKKNTLSITKRKTFLCFVKSIEILIFSMTTWGIHKHTWSRLEGTTVDAEGEILVGEGAEVLRRAELATWTTLVTVIVCLILFDTDCFVTTAPSDGNWFSWFKTNVVVEGWGLCCWWWGEEVDFNTHPTKKHKQQLTSVFTTLKKKNF